ncbi:MAG: type II toxin-antitoxin system VapC family toxin [Chloroflexota bacterium]
MYLWDTTILHAFIQGHIQLQRYLEHVVWSDIVLPSIVVAELMRSRCYATMNASPHHIYEVHQRLLDTQEFLSQFKLVGFNQQSEEIFIKLTQTHRQAKAHSDLMISAIAQTHNYQVITTNMHDFAHILPPSQLANWLAQPLQQGQVDDTKWSHAGTRNVHRTDRYTPPRQSDQVRSTVPRQSTWRHQLGLAR